MPEPPSAESTVPHYDAFLSYSRADGAAVRRIQRFLESYRPPGRSTRLKVYLDETDMRGGSLPDNLSVALGQSRALVVCWSDNAARSQWVNAEIAEFRKLGRPNDIAVTHVAGDGPTVRHEAFTGLTPIEHDLRHGWFGWFLRSKARIELLRLIAFLTGVEMRLLHNWARRRLLRNASIGVAVGLLPVIGVLSVTQPHWESVASNLTFDEAPMQPLACEVIKDKLWVAAWSEAAGEFTGKRDYFVTYPDALTEPFKAVARPSHFKLARRALPEDLVDPDVMGEAAKVLGSREVADKLAQSPPGDLLRIAQPRPDRFVFIQPIAFSESEIANPPPVNDGLPEPETNGSWVVTHDGSGPKTMKVVDLSPPLWNDPIANEQNFPPVRAISIAWQGNNEIWIGVRGERKAPGGLWHSPDGGGSWNKIDEFVSVTSLGLVGSTGGKETLLVAEDNFKRLHTRSNVPGSARIMERADGDRWTPVSALPYGSDSEIEICGTLPNGMLYVRVDGTIYQKSSRSLLRSVLEGSGN
jgi:hypothetical protein